MKCPNCKKNYKLCKSDDRYFKKMMKHESSGCPFGLITYQHTEEACKNSVKEHIARTFPWTKKG